MSENQTAKINVTIKIFRIYQIINILIFAIFGIGASISAVQRGYEPVWGPVVAILVCTAGATINHLIINFAIKNLKNANPLAYIISIFISIQLLIFIIGFFSLFELLRKHNRRIFLPFFD